MFDDLLEDLFDRDRRDRRPGGKRRGGLLGRLTTMLGDDDRDRSYRRDDDRYRDDRHRDDRYRDDRYRDDRYQEDRYRAEDRYRDDDRYERRRYDDDDRGYRKPRKRREFDLFDVDD